MATLTKARQVERDEALAKLRELVEPGETLFTVLRHVSRSGMSRSIDVFTVADGEPYCVTYLAARALGDSTDQRHGGIKMGGCGMDMGFALVYNLSHALYGDGYHCTGVRYRSDGQACGSNEHVNPGPERDNYSTGKVHRDGYAISQRWL